MTLFVLLSTAWLAIPLALLPMRRTGRSGRTGEIRGALTLLWWLNRAYCSAWHRLVLLNRPQLPEHGPALLVANHTSGVDNFIIQAGCRRVLGFMIAREFHENPWVRPLTRLLRCIPVKRDGRDLSAMREALRALESGRVLPIFPEGKITPKSGREFGPGKSGAAYLALRSGVPVFPAYLRGTPETRTVWEALVTPSRARVLFGPPIDLADLRRDDPPTERARIADATERLMGAIRSLRDESLAREPGM